MKRKKIVVALGHKALGTTLPEQKAAVKRSAKVIADLVAAGASRDAPCKYASILLISIRSSPLSGDSQIPLCKFQSIVSLIYHIPQKKSISHLFFQQVIDKR